MRCRNRKNGKRRSKMPPTEQPGFVDLFHGPIRRITFTVILVCATSLTAHWAFMFWFPQQLAATARRANVDGNSKKRTGEHRLRAGDGACRSSAIFWRAIWRNFRLSPRGVVYVSGVFRVDVGHVFGGPESSCDAVVADRPGLSQGVFALFTMYLPPLFPTLLRTTGAGFCYNIGRIAAAAGTIYFGSFSDENGYRMALLYASFLFLPAAAFALLLPELPQIGQLQSATESAE